MFQVELTNHHEPSSSQSFTRKKNSQLYMVADSTTRNIPYYNKGCTKKTTMKKPYVVHEALASPANCYGLAWTKEQCFVEFTYHVH